MRFGDGLRATGARRKLVAYLMVDRARRHALVRLAEAARDAGADALELGFPFSDPIADGPVLQAAANRALRHGTNWADLLESLRTTSAILPTAVMSYANPIWQRGLARSTAMLRRAGAGGLIVPDLSLEEAGPWRRTATSSEIDLILLAAPGTSTRRTRALARATSGLLYLVSRYGTTGTAGTAAHGLGAVVRASRAAAPRVPVLVGFGIHDAASARWALGTGADGVIVATAIEEALARDARPSSVAKVLRPIRRALGSAAG